MEPIINSFGATTKILVRWSAQGNGLSIDVSAFFYVFSVRSERGCPEQCVGAARGKLLESDVLSEDSLPTNDRESNCQST
jgi:hypothetical protein